MQIKLELTIETSNEEQDEYTQSLDVIKFLKRKQELDDIEYNGTKIKIVKIEKLI